MFAITLSEIPYLRYLITSPYFLVITAFQLWMLIDAIRRREWMWTVFIFFGIGAILYFFYVYRGAPSATQVAGRGR